jgi:PadR family transcriptional regulator PadR
MSELRRELLGSLISGPAYGLEILDRVRLRTDGKMRLSPGGLYPALRSLERDGLLESFEGETVPERDGRPRIYYELTGEGRRVALDKDEPVSQAGGMGLAPALS